MAREFATSGEGRGRRRAAHAGLTRPPPPLPARSLDTVQVSFYAMPMYAMLPTLTEYCVEQGWTMSYSRCVRGGLAGGGS